MQYTAIIKDGGLFIQDIFKNANPMDFASQSIIVNFNPNDLSSKLKLTSVQDNDKHKKFDLGQLSISAFNDIDDPVKWQNEQRDEWT